MKPSWLFSPRKLVVVLVIIVNAGLSYLPFFGEEYGWRYFHSL